MMEHGGRRARGREKYRLPTAGDSHCPGERLLDRAEFEGVKCLRFWGGFGGE